MTQLIWGINGTTDSYLAKDIKLWVINKMNSTEDPMHKEHWLHLLLKYWNDASFPPADNVYYTIIRDEKNSEMILKRDIIKSPKKKVDMSKKVYKISFTTGEYTKVELTPSEFKNLENVFHNLNHFSKEEKHLSIERC